MKALKTGDLIVIWARDITSVDTWLDATDAEDYEAINIVTCGFVVNEDNNVIRLSTMLSEDGQKNILVMPKGWIEKIQVVKYGK